MPSLEEHETSVNYDHFEKKVLVYTTREGVVNKIERRLGRDNVFTRTIDGGGWEAEIPFSECRTPEMIVRIGKNSELKSEPGSMAAAFAAQQSNEDQPL